MNDVTQVSSKEQNEMSSFVTLVNSRFDKVMTFMNNTEEITGKIISAMQNDSIKHLRLEENYTRTNGAGF